MSDYVAIARINGIIEFPCIATKIVGLRRIWRYTIVTILAGPVSDLGLHRELIFTRNVLCSNIRPEQKAVFPLRDCDRRRGYDGTPWSLLVFFWCIIFSDMRSSTKVRFRLL